MGYKLGVDTGGTFTDISLIDEQTGQVVVTKVPSTPDNPAEAVINGVNAAVEKAKINYDDINFFIHGTTVATNALLELKGDRTAIITTEGFKDVLHIARQTRPRLYDFWARRPDSPVPRNLRFEVPERILYTGEVLKSLDEDAVYEIADIIKKENVVSVAICLLHSYINPEHEEAIKNILKKECPEIFITVSSEVLAEFREYERMSTVAINAYVMPRVNRYVSFLENKLKEMDVKSGLYIMQSNGGVITSHTAREASARTLLSGPAGGALAGIFTCKNTGRNNIITVDMGGTSFDICLVENQWPQYTTESLIGNYPLKLPMIDIHTIGAGGGSIAWIDEGGALRVGPHSAGAVPGPVAYQRGGTEPTVTDANIILGRINPNYILGGDMEVDIEGARKVIKDKIAEPLGVETVEAAAGIIRVVNANMVRGMRVVSVEKGHDPREFSLVPFGGAGPLHAIDIARELGMEEVIVPLNPGVNSAIGMLSADVRHDYVKTYVTSTSQIKISGLVDIYNQLEKEATEQLANEGFKKEEMIFLRSVDMRYKGQSYELNVELPSGKLKEEVIGELEKAFHEKHMKLYGYQRVGEIIEMVNFRVTALGKLPELDFKVSEGATEEGEPIDNRPVYFEGRYKDTNVYARDNLVPGQTVKGPAVIEQLDSTIIVFPDQEAHVDGYRNMIIHMNGSEA